MEKDLPQANDSKPLEFPLDSYAVRVVLDGSKLTVRAYSDLSSKLFEGVLQVDDFSEQDKFAFDDCK